MNQHHNHNIRESTLTVYFPLPVSFTRSIHVFKCLLASFYFCLKNSLQHCFQKRSYESELPQFLFVGEVFIFSFLKDSFVACRIVDWQLFSLQYFEYIFPLSSGLQSFTFQKSTYGLLGVLLYLMCIFSHATFKILCFRFLSV